MFLAIARTPVYAINSSKKPLFGGVKASRGMCYLFYVEAPRNSLLFSIVRKCRKCPILDRKSARFPCQNANLPHCTYFTHVRLTPPRTQKYPRHPAKLSEFCAPFFLKSLREEREGKLNCKHRLGKRPRLLI